MARQLRLSGILRRIVSHPVRRRRAAHVRSRLTGRRPRFESLESRVLLFGPAAHDLFDHEVFPSGGGQGDWLVADVNRDGISDLIGVNGELHGEVSILIGDGAGHFARRSVQTVGKYPVSIAAADINGDGSCDLLVGNVGSFSDGYERTVSVLRGRGDGTFLAPTQVSTGGRPQAIVAADFTGDGKVDFVSVNKDDPVLTRSYSLLAGLGNGSFAARVDKPLSFYPEDVAAGDLNGDLQPDLLISHQQSIHVLLAQGGGVFAAGTDYAMAGSGSTRLVLADLNRDNRLDVVASGEISSSISVLVGQGNGTLSLAAEYTAMPRPSSVLVTDVSGDATPDVITGSWQDGYVAVRPGRGDGTFGSSVASWVGGKVAAIAVGDFDRDGRPDIAADNANDGYLTVLAGAGNGRFAARRTVWPASGNPTTITQADLNGDHITDLVAFDPSRHVVSLLLGAAGAAFGPYSEIPVGLTAQSLRTADFNGDQRGGLAADQRPPDSDRVAQPWRWDVSRRCGLPGHFR